MIVILDYYNFFKGKVYKFFNVSIQMFFVMIIFSNFIYSAHIKNIKNDDSKSVHDIILNTEKTYIVTEDLEKLNYILLNSNNYTFYLNPFLTFISNKELVKNYVINYKFVSKFKSRIISFENFCNIYLNNIDADLHTKEKINSIGDGLFTIGKSSYSYTLNQDWIEDNYDLIFRIFEETEIPDIKNYIFIE